VPAGGAGLERRSSIRQGPPVRLPVRLERPSSTSFSPISSASGGLGLLDGRPGSTGRRCPTSRFKILEPPAAGAETTGAPTLFQVVGKTSRESTLPRTRRRSWPRTPGRRSMSSRTRISAVRPERAADFEDSYDARSLEKSSRSPLQRSDDPPQPAHMLERVLSMIRNLPARYFPPPQPGRLRRDVTTSLFDFPDSGPKG